jgi:hypothetical protein
MEAPVDFIPPLAQPLLLAFAPPFTHPTFQRWLLLCVAAIVTPGRRTISNVLRTVNVLEPISKITLKHFTADPRQL